MPTSAQISLSSPAVSSASWRDSTTHGPAIRNRGGRAPTPNQQTSMPRDRKGLSCDFLEPRPFADALLAARLGGVADGGADEGIEQRVAMPRRRGKFGMELAGDKPRMVGQLDHLAQAVARRHAAHL